MAAFINIEALAQQCAPQIHTTTMTTLIQHESVNNPYAIGVNGNYVLRAQPRTLEEAVKKATWLQKNGYNFDAGLAQINIRNARKMGLSIKDLFDPCKNISAAAVILSNCYTRAAKRYPNEQKALRAALSCYNTGNFKHGFSNGYVGKVVSKIPVQKTTKKSGAIVSTSDNLSVVPEMKKHAPTTEKAKTGKKLIAEG